MQCLGKVPCLNVTIENLETIWPSLIEKMRTSSFIAIDFEFSGIGDKIDFGVKDLEVRYDLLSGIVKERSVISIGLSLFEYAEPDQILVEKDKKRKKLEDGELENEIWKYNVSNYNIFCECEGDYVKEEQALDFLKKHGFDFDTHSKQAIKYKKGNDEEDNNSEEISIRNLFAKMLSFKRPIVLHNALLDIIYFYHHFYCELPNQVQTFICDLSELFKGGLYDTKFICELNTDLKISFLEYLFYYVQRMNILKITYDDDHFTLNLNQLDDKDDGFYDYGNLKTQILKFKPENLEVCSNYRNFGWCKERDDCTKSHNIDFILDSKFDNSKTKNRYKKDLKKMKELNESKESSVETDEIIKFSEKGGVHSAGFDAFMTGFCFSYFVLEYFEDMPMKMDQSNLKRMLKYVVNRVFLPFTNKHTLHLRKSEFSHQSRNHRIKCDKIFGVEKPTFEKIAENFSKKESNSKFQKLNSSCQNSILSAAQNAMSIQDSLNISVENSPAGQLLIVKDQNLPTPSSSDLTVNCN